MSDLSLRYLLYGEDRSATSTIGRVGGAFSKMGGQIGGEFGELMSKMGEAFDHLEGKQKNLGAKLVAGGGAAAGIGAALSMIGSADKQASDQLKAAVEASGHSYEDYAKGIEGAIKHQENFGHSAKDTQEALRKLTQATNDPKKALDDMGLVANLAASKHISLSEASGQVAKILSGHGGRTLAEYGITMGKTKDHTADVHKATDDLAKKLDGQASASTDNFSGKVNVVKTKLEDWTAVVGQKLGPALTALGPGLMAFGAVMEVIRARQVAAAAATSATAAAQTELDTAMDANPIGLVVVGIAALAAILVYAYKHSETFRKVVHTALHAVAAAFEWAWDKIKTAFNWLKDHWKLVLSILTGPIGAAVLFITSHWDQIITFVKKLPGRIASAASGMWDGIKDGFRHVINWVIDGWNKLVSYLKIPGFDSHIPGVPKFGGIDIGKGLQIPHYAQGTPSATAGWSVVGELGPELVRFRGGEQVVPHRAVTSLSQPRNVTHGGDIVLNFNGPVTSSPGEFARFVKTELLRLKRATGANLGLA